MFIARFETRRGKTRRGKTRRGKTRRVAGVCVC
jgi:hypothetical protein